jgi:hypothetical protein
VLERSWPLIGRGALVVPGLMLAMGPLACSAEPYSASGSSEQRANEKSSTQTFVVQHSWHAACVESECGNWLLGPDEAFRIKTPTGIDNVDVDVTASFDYRLSPRDAALVRITYVPTADVPRGAPKGSLAPSSYPLVGSTSRSGATFIWAGHGLEGGGTQYSLQLEIKLDDTSNGVARIDGRKLALKVTVSWN